MANFRPSYWKNWKIVVSRHRFECSRLHLQLSTCYWCQTGAGTRVFFNRTKCREACPIWQKWFQPSSPYYWITICVIWWCTAAFHTHIIYVHKYKIKLSDPSDTIFLFPISFYTRMSIPRKDYSGPQHWDLLNWSNAPTQGEKGIW